MKKNLLVLIIMFVGIITCFGAPKTETATVYMAVDSAFLCDMMKEQGYSAKLDSEADIVWMIDGIKCHIVFTDGTKNSSNFYFRCGYTFREDDASAAVKAISLCNDYNKKFKFGKSYVEKNAVVYQLSLDLQGGISKNRLLNFFKSCKSFAKDWKEKVVDNI